MKKLIPLLLAVFAFAACEKDPDTSRLDNKFLVYTDHDTQADFQSFRTYYLPDSILVIGSTPAGTYWKDADAQEILTAYAGNMTAQGFARTGKRAEADLGLQVSYVESYYHFTDWGRPEWWWNYPGYWGVPYWGNWGGWYYPYAVSYSYSTGTFIAELLNLNAPQGADKRLPVVWSCYMGGLLSNSARVNTRLAVEGVNQAFAQSAYLGRQ